MARPDRTTQRELDDLDQHSATIALLLDILRIGRDNAKTKRLIARLDLEIARAEERQTDIQTRRRALQRQLGAQRKG